MRTWINMADTLCEAHTPGQTILITDLYDSSDLTDETELLSQYAPPADWDTPLTVKTMSPEDAAHIDTGADISIVDAYQSASQRQQNLVKRKMKDFDDDRVIVICDGRIIDGNHHLMAAILLGRPVLYVDLADWD